MPQFKDVIEHEKIIKHFQTAMRTGQVSHAYILEGETGSGKKLLAKAFAQALECEDGTGESCNTCHSCMLAESGNHPDIIWVTHEKPNTISVADIRSQVNGDIGIKPYSGRYKIYIIDQADRSFSPNYFIKMYYTFLKTITGRPNQRIHIGAYRSYQGRGGVLCRLFYGESGKSDGPCGK